MPSVFRFSLATLLAVMTCAAVVCVGLAYPSQNWSAFIGSITILALLSAVLASVYQRGQARAFAIGFAIFGIGYLLCLHRVESYSPALLSRRAGDQLFKIMHKDEWDSTYGTLREPDLVRRIAARHERFVEILQSVSILVVAVCGGFLGRYLVAKNSRQIIDESVSVR
jgi:hypothetical protein